MRKLFLPSTEAQPLFPFEDLTDHNASVLECSLTESLTVDSSHEAAEKTSLAYRQAHPAIDIGSQRSFGGSYVHAVSHGTTVMEAIDNQVAGSFSQRSNAIMVAVAVTKILDAAANEEFRDHATEALFEFKEQMPNTADVITYTSRPHLGHLTDYAVLGAAIERKLVLGSSEY